MTVNRQGAPANLDRLKTPASHQARRKQTA
jgi:hypothetical protein